MRKTIILAFLASLGFAIPVAAQTPIIILPTSTTSFTASADQNTISLDGVTPLLTSYSLQYCLKSTPTTCLTAVSVGKPTPDGTNTITITTGLWAGIAKNTQYTETVLAIGPGGTAASAPSVPFGMEGPPASTPPPAIIK